MQHVEAAVLALSVFIVNLILKFVPDSVICKGLGPDSSLIIPLSRTGLLELSKSFLDPFGSRRASPKSFYMDIQVDVLLSESNAGANVWLGGAHGLPSFSKKWSPSRAV